MGGGDVMFGPSDSNRGLLRVNNMTISKAGKDDVIIAACGRNTLGAGG